VTTLDLPRILGPDGKPLRLDPDLDAPLVGPTVLALVGKASACEMWRVWQPFSHLQLHGYPAEWGWKDDRKTSDYWGLFQAIVLCRLSWYGVPRSHARKWFDLVKGAGKRIFYEVDDDLFSPFMVRQQKAGIASEETVEALEAQRVESVWTMSQCDGVTVSTQRLASVVRQYTDKPVAVIPNAIDAEWFQAVQRHGRRPVEGLTIGWAGGNRPDGDLREMAVAWGRIAQRHPRVTFVVFGHQPWVVSEHVPESRIKRVPWMAQHEYPLGLVGWDIGCCPLEDRPFNRCKTPIKAWEYALSGAAVVASPTVYGQCVRDGENGFIARDAREWEFCLSRLIEDEEHRRGLAGALKRDVLERWSLRRNYRRWPNAWRRLIEEGQEGEARA
jgi:glycosyltransferase involved in cell wall biosynthesis